jgi:butyrate kinase
MIQYGRPMCDSHIFRILVINPGSTSTKLSFFEQETEIAHENVFHPSEELKKFTRIVEQRDYRLGFIHRFIDHCGIEKSQLDAIVGRGGLLKPVTGGVYGVNIRMLEDLNNARYGEHASNLGGILAHEIAHEASCGAFIVDPVVVDEMEDVARVSGMPEIERRSIFHALNQKSAAREVSRSLGKQYAQCNFIVAHMGGGISVGAHLKGRVVDVNNALDGDGPFSPERSGGLPAGQLVRLCFEKRYTKEEILKKITGRGGVVAYRGTNSLNDVHRDVKAGDTHALHIYEAMAYQISQEICKHGATLKGEVDRIILTGGMAKDDDLIEMIRARVSHLAPVEVVPGEREMYALARGALSVLRHEEEEQEYR